MQLTLHLLNSNRFPGDDGEEEKTGGNIDAVTVRHRTPATKRDYARTSRKLKKWGKKEGHRHTNNPCSSSSSSLRPSGRRHKLVGAPELLLSRFSSELTALQCLPIPPARHRSAATSRDSFRQGEHERIKLPWRPL